MSKLFRLITAVVLMLSILLTQVQFVYAADTTPPTLESSNPANGATNVDFTSSSLDFVLTFSEPVEVRNELDGFATSGSINGNNRCISVAINQSGNITKPALSYTVNNNVVTISPGYYSNWNTTNNDVTATITIAADCVRDLAGNPISTRTIFLTGIDSVAPYVTGYVPATTNTLINMDASVIVYFSEQVQAGSQYDSITVIQDNTGDPVPINKTINGSTMTITPEDGIWGDGDDHTFTLSWFAGALTDRAGLSCPALSGRTFKTRDGVKPKLIAHYPLDSDSGILNTTTITMDYSEPIFRTGNLDNDMDDPIVVTVNGVFCLINLGVTGPNLDRLTISPAAGKWANDNEGYLVCVTVKTGALRDDYGNNIDQVSSFSFTLKDNIPPVINATDPLDNGTLVNESAPCKITFTKQIVQGENWDGISVEYNGSPVSITKQITDKTLTLSPVSGSWDNNNGVEYKVIIPAGAIKDKSGNGLVEEYRMSFNTVEPAHPSEVVVHFDMQYGGKVLDNVIGYNKPVNRPIDPARTGFKFGGWYSDPTCVTPWDFGSPIKEETRIYAKWVLVSLAAPKISATSAQYNSILVKWGAVENATGYEVWRATTSTGSYSRVGTTRATSLTVSGLTTGSTYYFKVRATGTGASTVYSSFSSAVSAKPIPATPASPKAAAVTYNSIKVTWAAVSGATKYEVYRATTKTGSYLLLTTTSYTYYANSSLKTGSAYYYKIRAYRLVGSTKVYSPFTAIISATPTLKAPTSIKAAVLSYNRIKVTWGAVAGATRYELYRATSSAGKYSLVTTTGYTYYTNVSLNTGTTYYYKVRAYRLVGRTKVYSGFSALGSAKPTLAVPGSVKASRLSSTTMKITWGTVSGATKYEVWQSKSDGVTGVYTYTLLATTGSAYYTSTSITPGKYYQYKVRAYRLVGTTKVYSGFSSVAVGPVYVRASSTLPYKYVNPNPNPETYLLEVKCSFGDVGEMNSVSINSIKDKSGQIWIGVLRDLNALNSISFPQFPGLRIQVVQKATSKVLFYYYVD